jgi:hypothetical protein
MGKHKRVARIKRSRADKLKLLLIAAGGLSLVVGLMWSGINSSSKPTGEDARIPAYFETEAQAKPLPVILNPDLFRNTAAFKAYQVAKEIPGVLAQQPCYCKCDRGSGHRSLADCYRDNHASTCLICIKEGLLAAKLTKEGVSVNDIRAAIIRGDWNRIEAPRP